MILELDSGCYTHRFSILENGYIFNRFLYNKKGESVLDLGDDSIYYNNKFYYFTIDVHNSYTLFHCQDISGNRTAVENKAEFDFYDIQAFESINDTIYILTNDAFYTYDTDGYEEKIFTLKDDVEVLDFKSVYIETDGFVFDSDNNIILYDSKSDSIRKISKNN